MDLDMEILENMAFLIRVLIGPDKLQLSTVYLFYYIFLTIIKKNVMLSELDFIRKLFF